MLRTVRASRYITPLREGGSLPAIVEASLAGVPLIAIIISLSDDKRIVGRYKTGKTNRVIAWITFGFMLLAVLLMVGRMIFR